MGRLIHLESCYNGIWFCYKKEQSTEWSELGMHPRICERSQVQKVCAAWLCLDKVSRTDKFVKTERRLSGVGGGVKNGDIPVEQWKVGLQTVQTC